MSNKKVHTPEWAIQEALRLARKAFALSEVPVGAVVLRDGKVVGRGYNRRESLQSPLEHAEVMAIAQACRKLKSWRLEDCEVIVTLEPCVMCAGLMQQARVKAVYFGAPDPKAGVMSLGIPIHNHPRLNHRYLMVPMQIQECGQLLTDFFRARRRLRLGKPSLKESRSRHARRQT